MQKKNKKKNPKYLEKNYISKILKITFVLKKTIWIEITDISIRNTSRKPNEKYLLRDMLTIARHNTGKQVPCL